MTQPRNSLKLEKHSPCLFRIKHNYKAVNVHVAASKWVVYCMSFRVTSKEILTTFV